MSIEVRVDGILLKPSDWHIDPSAKPLGIAFDFPLPVGAHISIYDTGPTPTVVTIRPPAWRYGDVGRMKGKDFMYVGTGDRGRWHEVIFLGRAMLGVISHDNLATANRTEVDA